MIKRFLTKDIKAPDNKLHFDKFQRFISKIHL